MRPIVAVLCVLISAPIARAVVRPHAMFTNHMVLQRGQGTPVYGTAGAGETVAVKLSGGAEKKTTVD